MNVNMYNSITYYILCNTQIVYNMMNSCTAYLYACIDISLSLSLSIYICIYIRIYNAHVYIYIYIYGIIHVWLPLRRAARRASPHR